jgi:D-3-phosphoglycerate dehydrogenase
VAYRTSGEVVLVRIFIADKLASFAAGRLQDMGAQVTTETGLAGPALTERLGAVDPEVLVVRSTKVGAADVAAARSLALIVRAGSGVNTIDLAAASARGVYVTNCPGRNAAAVAELTLAHLLNLDRRLADNVAALRNGTWDKKTLGVARGLRTRTLAVLGLGLIGREVARLARAFGMRVVAWSRSLTPGDADAMGVERADTPERAVAGADAVSVHLALTPETKRRIGASVFEAMAPGALFVNTSRAEVVDQAALERAILEKGVRAGLDVFDQEPSGGQGTFADPIARHAGVYGTCHIGASTAQAEEAVAEEVVRIVAAYREGRPIPNCVNLATRTAATHVLVVRHADRVGVLAGVLGVLRHAGINVEEMQNTVFDGAKAACARIAVVGEPDTETLDRIRGDDAIFSITVTAVG